MFMSSEMENIHTLKMEHETAPKHHYTTEDMDESKKIVINY